MSNNPVAAGRVRTVEQEHLGVGAGMIPRKAVSGFEADKDARDHLPTGK